MSAQFRCKRSGKILVFSQEHDILTMRKEPGYEEIREEIPLRAETPSIVAIPAKRGRPKKG